MKMQPIRLPRTGFSLVEMLIAIALMAIMTVSVTPQLRYLLDFQASADTRNSLNELLAGLSSAYQANVSSIEADANPEINFGAAGTMTQAVAKAGSRCNASANSFLPWASFTGRSAATLYKDGYGAPLCVLINPQASVLLDGFPLYYHVVAFVSTGANNILDAGTTLDAAGNLNLGGDDMGVVFDGRAFAIQAYNTTSSRIQSLSQALQAYYLARYQSDPTRSSSIDYWSNGAGSPDTSRWDASNPGNLIAYQTVATPMYTGTGSDMTTALGVSRNDVTDGYGNIVQFENASQAVRSPVNTVSDMAIPPYTAMISTTLPGNIRYSESVVGINN